MDFDFDDEEWENNWDDDELIGHAAGEVADEAQQCFAQPGGYQKLKKGLQITLSSIQLLSFGAFVKTASFEERQNAVTEMRSAVSQTIGTETNAESAAQSMSRFTQHLISDPQSPLNQAAMRSIAEYVSIRNTACGHVSHISESSKKRPTNSKLELESHSNAVITALYNTFHRSAYLPCSCPEKGGAMRLSDQYFCALRLDGIGQGTVDDQYDSFDSVIADKHDNSYQWTPVQFQLPRGREGKARLELSSSEDTDVESKSLAHQAFSNALNHFCDILTWNIRCFRIRIIRHFDTASYGWSFGSFSSIFPKQGAPQLLSEALMQDELSARHKIFLAFAISKAVWKYYLSEWMNAEWSLETIQLLKTSSVDSQAPFLKITTDATRAWEQKENEYAERSNDVPFLHPYSYVLNLGLLLVQIGSIKPLKDTVAAIAAESSDAEKSNAICISCCTEVSSNGAWPAIDLPEKHKTRYRRIVEECLPIDSETCRPLFQEKLDATGRRSALENHVVRPLFDLFQEMACPDMMGAQKPKVGRSTSHHGLQTDGTDKEPKTENELAWDWLDTITKSWLHEHVTDNTNDDRRPTIAVIDTGFDSQTRFVDRKLKRRLGMLSGSNTRNCNWRDYWQSSACPQDEDGHGTAMLSVIHRIAPFANICVARIAGGDQDMKDDPKGTSNNLAKAITWAVEEQNADIISLSLGWEQEQYVDENRVVSNAISNALSHRNQDLLIFAAASNLGGSKLELFPAKHPSVISIRGTTTKGKHADFNPSLPDSLHQRNDDVFGTLGIQVPTSNRGSHSPPQFSPRNGTSVATAIAAGIAGIVIGYININDAKGAWGNVRTREHFQTLLYKLSTEPEVRKRFITLEHYSEEEDQTNFEAALSSASN